MTRDTAAAACGIAASVFALAVPVLGGLAEPGYSHVSQYISELGATGAANGRQVGMLGFAPTGVLVLLFLASARWPASWQSRGGALALTAVGLAYVVSAYAPCDPGCPASGSWSQSLHNVFGVGEYVGASTGLVLMALAVRACSRWRRLHRVCVICAVLVMAGFAAMLMPSLAAYRGAWQRLADASIFLWIAAVSFHLLRVDSDAPA